MRSAAEASAIATSHAWTQRTASPEPSPGHLAISAVLVHALLDAAEAHGARRQSILGAVGRDAGHAHGDGWVDPQRFSRLIEVAAEQTGDHAFGLHWGERTPFTNFGIVASLALWSPSPRTALSALVRFQGLLFQGRPIASFAMRGPIAALRFDQNFLSKNARRTWAEFVVAGTSQLLQQLCGSGALAEVRARAVFEHAAPAYLQEYARVLGHMPTFESAACGVELDGAQLDRALPQFNERLNEAVLFEAGCALAKLGGLARCSARVREQLASALPSVPTMEDMARKLGMSSRTLRRHLEQEGTAFPSLVAEALRARALRLLGDPQSSVKEVAYALGFATPSAFHRAFKRWTGSSPSEVRASGLSPDDHP